MVVDVVRMERYEEITVASMGRLATHGWVVGPPLEPEEWRRRVKAAVGDVGGNWQLATGNWSPCHRTAVGGAHGS